MSRTLSAGNKIALLKEFKRTTVLVADYNNNNNNNKLYLHDYNKVLQYDKSHLKFNY